MFRAMDGVRYLVEKFPNGYEGEESMNASSSGSDSLEQPVVAA